MGRCPSCGQGDLFQGYLKVANVCSVCHLDLSGEDAGDGAQAFVIFFGAAVGAAIALSLDLTVMPPIWVSTALALVGATVTVIGLLRSFKGALICLQYHMQAGDGQSGSLGRQNRPNPKDGSPL